MAPDARLHKRASLVRLCAIESGYGLVTPFGPGTGENLSRDPGSNLGGRPVLPFSEITCNARTMTVHLRQRVVTAVGDAPHPARLAVPLCPPPSCNLRARPRDARIAAPRSTQAVSAGTRRGGSTTLQAVPSQAAAQRSPAPARPDPLAAPAMLFVGFSSEEVAVLEECFSDDTTLGKPWEP